MKSVMLLGMVVVLTGTSHAADWVVDSQEEWEAATGKRIGIDLLDGYAKLSPQATDPVKGFGGVLHSKVQSFDSERNIQSLTIKQTDKWLNWQPIEKVQPKNLHDAPVFLVRGDKDYWIFGRYAKPKVNKPKKTKHASNGEESAPPVEIPVFKGEPAKLEGFEFPLMTTPYPNQFDAPGGLKKSLGGYHAWQSRDMKNWVHHGPVSEGFSKWVTTAEMVDGKLYLYYDFPNDQDPHLYIDDDLTDGVPGENIGLAFNDPSDGSDCAVIRDLDGRFHVIYEDWSPINAKNHSWDSPLAGHAVGEKGFMDFQIVEPAVDLRTKPTGVFKTYNHPHWTKEDPKRFKSNVAKYEVHEPEQDAFGDWAAIAIGGQYYLFADYHPVNDKIRIGWFTSSDINKAFEFCGEIGSGHPDPDIGFAEGKFYLINQTKYDYISDGPWVNGVEARVGVDVDGDGEIDQWTDWKSVSESYDYIDGFAKQIKRNPARLDASGLPAGKGFGFEIKVSHLEGRAAKPELDRVTLEFEN